MNDERWKERIEGKLDRIVEIQGDMKVVQAEQHLVLKEHMKRTALNELAIKKIDARDWRAAKLLIAMLGLISAHYLGVDKWLFEPLVKVLF